MFLQMLFATIPRSWRAAVALLVMLVAIRQGFSDFTLLVLPGTSKFKLVEGTFWLIVGLAAVTTFYYFQNKDAAGKKYSGLETLGKAYESQRKERVPRSKTVTPVFPDLKGEITSRDNQADKSRM